MTAMICPQCHTSLHITRDPHGAIWVCDRCGGAAANLAVLRKRLMGDLVTAFWRRMLAENTSSGRPCPWCEEPMNGFRMPLDGHQVSLDLCKKCQVVWFDGGELEAMPKAQDPDSDMSPEARHQLAIFKIQQRDEFRDEIENDAAGLQNWIAITQWVFRILLRLLFRV